MSKAAIQLLVQHLITLSLAVGCLLVAESRTDGTQLVFAVAAGALLIVVVGTAMDYVRAFKADLERE